MFNKIKTIIIQLIAIIQLSCFMVNAAITPANPESQPFSSKEIVEKLLWVEVYIAEEVISMGNQCTAEVKRIINISKELQKEVEVINWEKPTKERVILMTMLQELNSITSCIAGAYLVISSLPYTTEEALPGEVTVSFKWVTTFYGRNIINSVNNLKHHADISDHKELAKKVKSEIRNIKITFITYINFLLKVGKALDLPWAKG